MQVKIGDFGLACMENTENARTSVSSPKALTASMADMQIENDVVDLNKTQTSNEHTRGVGTSLYASPEQLKGKVYDKKVF